MDSNRNLLGRLRAKNRRKGQLRRGALSRRGRMTLIAVAIAGVGLLVVQARSPLAGSEGPDRFALSLPGSARHEQRKLNSAPAYLFERLPVGRENGVFDFALAHLANQPAGTTFSSASSDPFTGSRLVEVIDAPEGREDLRGPLRVEYSIDSDLTSRIFRILRASRVERGHVIVLDPHTGRVLAYTSTDPENFPPTRAYPAASLIKVVTAAAVLDVAPEAVSRPCRYRGSPYRLTRSRIKRPSVGREISLEGALATSNNQCFAQLAVNSVGGSAMLDAIRRFGWLDPPAPGHEAGRVNLGDDDYDLGRLGCGLAGCKITPLHAVGLAATLATGEALEPWWVDRVLDADGKELSRPPRAATRRVMSEDQAKELRRMMVRTTARGTARRAFRDRRGRPKLGSIAVAGKTGNLSGKDPNGRYEWFVGAAPADDPSIAIAVVQVQGHLWWKKSSEIAADVLSQVFCERRRCDPDLAGRFTGSLGESVSPVFLSESGH